MPPRLRRSLLRRYRLFAPRLLRMGLVLLALLLLGDGLAALQGTQMQAALSLNTSVAREGGMTPAGEGARGPQVVLASDSFQRADQAYWGRSSGGESWLADAQADRNFTVSHGAGLVNAAPGCLTCEAVLGPMVANVEVSFSASLSHYGPAALGAILRWDGANNCYKIALDGQNLLLWRVMDALVIPLQSLPFPARDGVDYTFRFRAVGSQLFAMVWPTDQPPPANWQLSVIDHALSVGRAGIGVLISQGAQAKITAFREVAL